MKNLSEMTDDEIFALGAQGGKNELTRAQLERKMQNEMLRLPEAERQRLLNGKWVEEPKNGDRNAMMSDEG